MTVPPFPAGRVPGCHRLVRPILAPLLVVCFARAALCGALPAGAPPVQYFEDVTHSARVSFRHEQGSLLVNLPETIGSGVALLDFDGDGLLDIFFVQGGGPTNGRDRARVPACQLYRNLDGVRFEEVAPPAGVDRRGSGMGCLAADLDNDGHIDLVVTGYGEPTTVHLNNGDGTFREAAEPLGLQGDRQFSSFVTALDYDRDGAIDLYLGRYVRFGPEHWVHDPGRARIQKFPMGALADSLSVYDRDPLPKTLYRNELPGPFQDVTARAGVADPAGRGLGSIGADLDGDGWPDLVVADDMAPVRLFRNLGTGRFEDLTRAAWLEALRANMGLALCDYRAEGSPALVVTHWWSDIPALYVNVAGSRPGASVRMVDRGAIAGLGAMGTESVGWGVGFLDVDNDARDDLLIINGHTHYSLGERGRLARQRAHLYVNGPEGRFVPIRIAHPDDPLGRARVGRGAAFGDLDRDGTTDVVVTSNNDAAEIWRGRPPSDPSGPGNSWIGVELVGTLSNRQAIGARLGLLGPTPATVPGSGLPRRVRELICGESFLSSNSRTLLFGLGGRSEPVTIDVRWPSGREDRFVGLVPRRFVRLVETTGLRPRGPPCR